MVVYKHICCKPYLPYYDFHTVTHILLKYTYQHSREIHKIKPIWICISVINLDYCRWDILSNIIKENTLHITSLIILIHISHITIIKYFTLDCVFRSEMFDPFIYVEETSSTWVWALPTVNVLWPRTDSLCCQSTHITCMSLEHNNLTNSPHTSHACLYSITSWPTVHTHHMHVFTA